MRVSGRNISYIQPQFFNDINRWIDDNKYSQKNLRKGMDALTGLMAMTCLSYAQEKSRGPLDPYGKRREKAWLIPVRRISQEYYYAWYEERISQGHWEVGNRSREAWYIEFGINHQNTGRDDSAGNRVRIRRPIMKLSVIATLKYIDKTQASEKVMSHILIGDNNRSAKRSIAGQEIQSSRVGTVIGGRAGTISTMRNA